MSTVAAVPVLAGAARQPALNRRESASSLELQTGEQAARAMFALREVETYMNENLDDVALEGRWRTHLSKDIAQKHQKLSKALEMMDRALAQVHRTVLRQAVAVSPGAPLQEGGSKPQLSQKLRAPSLLLARAAGRVTAATPPEPEVPPNAPHAAPAKAAAALPVASGTEDPLRTYLDAVSAARPAPPLPESARELEAHTLTRIDVPARYCCATQSDGPGAAPLPPIPPATDVPSSRSYQRPTARGNTPGHGYKY